MQYETIDRRVDARMLRLTMGQAEQLNAFTVGVFNTSTGGGQKRVQPFMEKRLPQFEGKASRMPPFYPWWK